MKKQFEIQLTKNIIGQLKDPNIVVVVASSFSGAPIIIPKEQFSKNDLAKLIDCFEFKLKELTN